MLDILITKAVVITMEGKGVGVIEEGALGIKGDKIAVVGKNDEVLKKYRAHRYIDATGKAVMPGLIDAHIHTGLGILRGLSQDTNHWMQKGLWPFHRVLTAEESIIGSRMNIIEGVKSGTTTFCDYDYPMGEIVKNHVEIGTRARVADMINELPPDMGSVPIGEIYPLDPATGNKKLQENVKLIHKWQGKENGRITCLLGPQGPDMLSKELLLEVKNLAQRYNTYIHMHVAQGDRETNQMLKRYGKRSISYLDSIGYLDSHLMAVHLTEATREETQLLAKRGGSMILCSGSIGIIDGVVPPFAEFLEVSNRGALGSDQAPGNNCNNMFNEMKFTAILNKCKAKDPMVFPAWKVLRLATIEAAQAIGLGDQIGSIKVGKKADLIIIDLDSPNLCPIIHYPIRNIVPNLVYAAKGNEVEMVIIDGKFVVEGRKIKTIDEKKAIREAHQVGKKIGEKATEDVIRCDTPIMKMMEEGYL